MDALVSFVPESTYLDLIQSVMFVIVTYICLSVRVCMVINLRLYRAVRLH